MRRAMMGGSPLLIVTGAAGGIGHACARLLGHVHPLLLTDRAGSGVEELAAALVDEGYLSVDALSGDLTDEALLDRLGSSVGERPFLLVHCAGLSPSLADWRRIMQVNLVASEMLLRQMERVIRPGSVAVLLSSGAGYRASPTAERALPADALAPDFLDRVGEAIAAEAGEQSGAAEGLSYALSKRGVHLLAERRALAWGRQGARIVSVSPTLTLTAMGRSEIAATPAAQAFVDSAPLGRMGTPADVAMLVEFLVSDRARFITGCDIRVDGGAVALTRHGHGPKEKE